MQFFTRVLIVLAVLGGLGYGSYAFGKYVLSARLFGPQKGAQTTTTASVGSDSSRNPEDVEIVPAPRPTRNSEDTESVPIVMPSATPGERTEVVPSSRDDRGSTRDSNANRPEPTRRPRRRRRARPTPRPEPRRESRPPVTSPVEPPPTRSQNVDPPVSGNSGNDTPNVETPRRSDPVPAPTRRRERRTDVAPAPRVETPREEAPRIREPRRDTSPVPVPEGARGGSSPIPIPG